MNEQRILLRQRRDLNEIIEAALALYTRNFWPLFKIASIVIPLGIAGAVFQASIDDEVTAAVVVGAVNVADVAVNVLAAAALIVALVEIDAGRPADFSRAYDVAFERFRSIVGALLRIVFHVLLFAITIIGIPWAIQRAIRWLFIQQAVIMDGSGWKQALSTSSDAVIGSWWRTFGIWLLITLLMVVPASIAGAAFTLAPIVVSGTIGAIVNALLLPFGVTALTLLYLDLKARKQAEEVAM